MRRAGGFTNCVLAELFLNGRSLGVKAPDGDGGHTVWWDVPYEAGTLTLNGLNESRQVVASDTLKTSGPATRLLVETDALTLAADGLDLAHVLVTAADEHGTPVYDAGRLGRWRGRACERRRSRRRTGSRCGGEGPGSRSCATDGPSRW